MTDVLLIDLSGLYWANWHATADQDVSEAHKRTLAQVHAFRDGFDHVAICCDAAPYWRREILPEYKSQREAAPPAAVEQLRRVKDRLRADGLLLWESKGFEADDVIAFGVAHALEAGHDVRIISSDKDMHQLVSDRVRVVSPAAGVEYDVDKVREKHGVPPSQMRDFLALCGDSSDNVPGIPGVGPKTAAALLATFGTVAEVVAAALAKDERFTKPKLLASLQEHGDAALLAYRVIGLRTDVPLEWAEIYETREPQALATTEPSRMDDEPKDESAHSNGNGNGNGAKAAEVVTTEQATAAKSQALAVRAVEEWSLALEPRSQKGAWELAGALHSSRLYQQFGSQEAIYAVVIRGRALGLDATTALAVFHNIGGKLTMHADLIEARVLQSGKAEYFEMVESSAKQATYATKRIGGRREQTLTFTIEDAFHAGLVKRDEKGQDGYLGISESGKPSNWDKWRATMLRHRCKTQLARTVYSDVVLGLYSPDEMDEQHANVIEARVA